MDLNNRSRQWISSYLTTVPSTVTMKGRNRNISSQYQPVNTPPMMSTYRGPHNNGYSSDHRSPGENPADRNVSLNDANVRYSFGENSPREEMGQHASTGQAHMCQQERYQNTARPTNGRQQMDQNIAPSTNGGQQIGGGRQRILQGRDPMASQLQRIVSSTVPAVRHPAPSRVGTRPAPLTPQVPREVGPLVSVREERHQAQQQLLEQGYQHARQGSPQQQILSQPQPQQGQFQPHQPGFPLQQTHPQKSYLPQGHPQQGYLPQGQPVYQPQPGYQLQQPVYQPQPGYQPQQQQVYQPQPGYQPQQQPGYQPQRFQPPQQVNQAPVGSPYNSYRPYQPPYEAPYQPYMQGCGPPAQQLYNGPPAQQLYNGPPAQQLYNGPPYSQYEPQPFEQAVYQPNNQHGMVPRQGVSRAQTPLVQGFPHPSEGVPHSAHAVSPLNQIILQGSPQGQAQGQRRYQQPLKDQQFPHQNGYPRNGVNGQPTAKRNAQNAQKNHMMQSGLPKTNSVGEGMAPSPKRARDDGGVRDVGGGRDVVGAVHGVNSSTVPQAPPAEAKGPFHGVVPSQHYASPKLNDNSNRVVAINPPGSSQPPYGYVHKQPEGLANSQGNIVVNQQNPCAPSGVKPAKQVATQKRVPSVNVKIKPIDDNDPLAHVGFYPDAPANVCPPKMTSLLTFVVFQPQWGPYRSLLNYPQDWKGKRKLAEANYGKVYLFYHIPTGETLVIKRMSNDRVHSDGNCAGQGLIERYCKGQDFDGENPLVEIGASVMASQLCPHKDAEDYVNTTKDPIRQLVNSPAFNNSPALTGSTGTPATMNTIDSGGNVTPVGVMTTTGFTPTGNEGIATHANGFTSANDSPNANANPLTGTVLTLPPNRAGVEVEGRGIFTASNFHCKYVLKMKGCWTDQHYTYYASEPCMRGELFSLVAAKAKLSEWLSRSIIKQLMIAVKYLHDRGIAHRDISLENVLLTDDEPEEMVRLMDFGVACSMYENEEKLMSSTCKRINGGIRFPSKSTSSRLGDQSKEKQCKEKDILEKASVGGEDFTKVVGGRGDMAGKEFTGDMNSSPYDPLGGTMLEPLVKEHIEAVKREQEQQLENLNTLKNFQSHPDLHGKTPSKATTTAAKTSYLNSLNGTPDSERVSVSKVNGSLRNCMSQSRKLSPPLQEVQEEADVDMQSNRTNKNTMQSTNTNNMETADVDMQNMLSSSSVTSNLMVNNAMNTAFRRPGSLFGRETYSLSASNGVPNRGGSSHNVGSMGGSRGNSDGHRRNSFGNDRNSVGNFRSSFARSSVAQLTPSPTTCRPRERCFTDMKAAELEQLANDERTLLDAKETSIKEEEQDINMNPSEDNMQQRLPPRVNDKNEQLGQCKTEPENGDASIDMEEHSRNGISSCSTAIGSRYTKYSQRATETTAEEGGYGNEMTKDEELVGFRKQDPHEWNANVTGARVTEERKRAADDRVLKKVHGYVGKDYYRPPEMYRKDSSYHAGPADIFAVGVCLFIILTGRPMWKKAKSPDPVFEYMKRNGFAGLINEWKLPLSPEAYDLIPRMVAFDPEQRLTADQVLAHPFFTKHIPVPEDRMS